MAEDTMYLTVDRDREKGGMIAVITRGQPQLGDESVVILSVERFKNMKEAKTWYRRMRVERPWEARQ